MQIAMSTQQHGKWECTPQEKRAAFCILHSHRFYVAIDRSTSNTVARNEKGTENPNSGVFLFSFTTGRFVERGLDTTE